MKIIIKIIAILGACILACLLCGCTGIQMHTKTYYLYDTIYGDYWTGSGWWTRDQAVVFDRGHAEKWLEDFRINERGEYSDTGPEDYPVVIKTLEPAGQAGKPYH